jgi:hypothetical protein
MDQWRVPVGFEAVDFEVVEVEASLDFGARVSGEAR